MRRFSEFSTENLGWNCLCIAEILFCLVVGFSDLLVFRVATCIGLFALGWTLAIRFYNNYKTKTVKILYWTVFSVLTVSLALFLFAPKKVAIMLSLILGYGELIASCIMYIQKVKNAPSMTDSSNQTKVKLKGLKRDSFAPMAWGTFAIFFLMILKIQHVKYSDEWIMVLIGGSIGLLVSVGIIIFLCLSKEDYLFEVERKISERIAVFFLIAMAGTFLGVITLMTLNIGLDGEPQVYTGKVVDMRSTSGKYASHYLEVSFEKGEESFSISGNRYSQTDIGDTVTIEYYEGAFGFEYMYVS